MDRESSVIVLKVARISKTFRTLSRDPNYFLPRPQNVSALAEVSFSISQGETVGLLGKNGAGKTTLLRLLTGSLSPTSGKILASSRPQLVGISGYQFPTLSLLQNAQIVYRANGLNGKLARRSAEELISEAGLEQKAHLPIESLSTGMRARFDFFLRTISRPQILLLDEMLSVSDKSFQNAAREKMSQLLTQNRATLISSHDLKSIEEFCSRVIVLEKGSVVFDGEALEGIRFYSRSL